MNPMRLALTCALLATPFIGVVTGCVRMKDEPQAFRCESEADCEDDEKCVYDQTDERVCKPIGWCEANTHCSGDERCENGACKKRECLGENDPVCGGYACNLYFGECTDSCFLDHDCRAGFTCNGGSCVATTPQANGSACTSSHQCVSNECCLFSSGGSGTCANDCRSVGAPCIGSADCASGFCCTTVPGMSTCSAQSCVPTVGCLGDFSCSIGEHCVNGTCRLPLGLDEACTQGAQCQSNTCENGLCKGRLGDACTTNADCGARRLCCPMAPSGELACSATDAQCLGSTPVGGSCSFDSDCSTNYCINGSHCSKTCEQSSDCGVSPWGVANVCDTDQFGSKTCFPGCISADDCLKNLGSDYSCSRANSSFSSLCRPVN